MSQDVITVGSTMRILLLYRGEYSQWREQFMNYLEEQTDDLWDALERQMRGFEYAEQDRKAIILYEYETFKATEGEQLLDTYLQWEKYGTLVRQTKNLMDINTVALYNIMKQNQGDMNDALGYKKKAVVVTSDPLALVGEKTKVSKRKKKVKVQTEYEESDDEDISDLKKITTLLAKAFNRKKYYAKPTNNNLRTFSSSSSANKKPEYVKSVEKKDKKADEKKRDMNDYFQEVINPYFEKIDSSFQQTSSLKPYVPTVILEKIIIDMEDEVVSLLEKEKVNLETTESLKSKGFKMNENAISKSENQIKNDCQVVEKECDQMENSKVIASGMFKLSVSQSVSPISISVRRPKQSSVIWKKKGSSNTSNVDLSFVSHLKLNNDVKRYSRKDLLSCNNSHLKETSSVYVCNDAMIVSCNSRLCDSFDENNLFIFDDESVRISPVSKMPFRKKPRDYMNLRIIDSGCSKHMAGNRALLTNFVEKFLGTIRFSNNDFVVIAGYGDVVIGSVAIKKVYYVEGLGHNLVSVGQVCDKGLEVAFRKSTCFVRNEDGVDLLTVVQKQRRLNPNMHEVVKKEIVKLLDAGVIYLIADSPWVSPIQCVPKKGGITVVTNKNDELAPTRTVTGWRALQDIMDQELPLGREESFVEWLESELHH
uniref:Integrase, catalytic region, zinc finger, CCHC-type, peptidase aspartic, catalytic n=1 Tax=Tanacetum cinerariifolium TaxID=118510 RepID=A0A6L2LZX6_TANCI|nr:integrase, catalytic region, zinc finger, CCHC-type, peptidase aspartic, catalytic [Tanacetum cinerariifolium]